MRHIWSVFATVDALVSVQKRLHHYDAAFFVLVYLNEITNEGVGICLAETNIDIPEPDSLDSMQIGAAKDRP